MKLSRLQVRNFRSLFNEDGRGNGYAVDLELTDGMNSLVGPNNCGKSNLVNAVAVALDPTIPVDLARTVPAQMGQTVKPRIALTFRVEGSTGPEKTLLRMAQSYEKSVHKGRTTFADDHELRFAVSLLKGGVRKETFLAKGAGALTGSADSPEFRALHKQFRSVVRFVLVRSGESIESLLQGRFREILRMVIRDHLRDEFDSAEEAREVYAAALQRELLGPLRDRIGLEVGRFFPEITATELIPDILSVEETLSEIGVRLRDTALTDLHGKGTGVRGTVLAAMLGYLANQTRRSMVFAVEEPEAFLHPAAQEQLRGNLEALAERDDVTLLVTSHSPYILSRDPAAQIVELRKDENGRTRLEGAPARGATPAGDRLGGLFRDAEVAAMLDKAMTIPETAEAILVVEGTTDQDYLELGAKLTGRMDLISNLHIVPANGAKKVVAQALMLKSVTERPVLVLTDADAHGKAARDKLKSIGDQWKPHLIGIASVPGVPGICSAHECEAEDLWPAPLLDKAVRTYGEGQILAERQPCKQHSPWHIGLNRYGKDIISDWLRENAKAEDCSSIVALLEDIQLRVGRAGSLDAS